MGYSTEVYEAAERELQDRRNRAEQELDRRRTLLYNRSPRAKEIEQLIAKTSVAAARAIFGGADRSECLGELRDKNLALQAELEGIITGFGFPKDYLDVPYSCKECSDRGNIDGKICTCMKRLLRRISYDKLNSTSPLSLSDFDSFSLDYYSDTPLPGQRISANAQMTKILAFCKKYARTFSSGSRSLLFQGAPGLGKTHLSLAIARELIQRDFGVIYVSAPSILSKLVKENYLFDSGRGDLSVEQMLTECDLLIIDDLGTEFTMRQTVSALYQIINARLITSKPLIISTNLTVTELQEKYDPRIISRIIGTLDRVEFMGTDIRQLKRRQKRS